MAVTHNFTGNLFVSTASADIILVGLSYPLWGSWIDTGATSGTDTISLYEYYGGAQHALLWTAVAPAVNFSTPILLPYNCTGLQVVWGGGNTGASTVIVATNHP